jgi:hypothetical protein
MTDELAARRRIRRDLQAHAKDLAPLKDPDHQARLTQHLDDMRAQEAAAPARRPRGRPGKGVGKYKQVVLYLPPETIAALDRLVDVEIQRTGHHVNRTDVMREAIQHHLTAALPPQAGPQKPSRRSKKP